MQVLEGRNVDLGAPLPGSVGKGAGNRARRGGHRLPYIRMNKESARIRPQSKSGLGQHWDGTPRQWTGIDSGVLTGYQFGTQ